MFVYAVKSSKIKLVLLLIVVALAIGALFYLAGNDAPAANDGGVSLKAGDAKERVAFPSQFSWEIEEDPVEVAEVIIPAEFDAAYEKYNSIQKKQNLDLSKYAGKRAKRWTYEIKNYPGYEGRDGIIQANLLVYNGLVIGGDVCSLELDGFIHGFDFPAEKTTAAPAATTAMPTTAAATG